MEDGGARPHEKGLWRGLGIHVSGGFPLLPVSGHAWRRRARPYLGIVSKPSKSAKKHHFVPQAQLRHFAQDPERRSIWVFDKITGRSWISSILNAGSENDFNTVALDAGKWNFEILFSDVDGRSAALVSEILTRGSVGWFGPDERIALIDLFATQILRTHFARTSSRHLAGQIRRMVRSLGYDPDDDPDMAMPTDSALRLGAVRAFLGRDRIARSMARLVPALFAAGVGQRFLLSDDPVAITNAFAYGDSGLASHGVIVLLPIAPVVAVSLVCPTILARYEAIDGIEIEAERRIRMAHYRDGFRAGQPIEIEPAELDGWNRRQVTRSSRYLYAATDDFEFARELLVERPELRHVETHIELGEMGRGPPPRAGMPAGWQLAIHGRFDHCLLPIAEIDEAGKGLTARTTSVELLELLARDRHDVRAELYEDGRPRQGMSAARLERLGEPGEGWFRLVHGEEGLRALMRSLDSERKGGASREPG